MESYWSMVVCVVSDLDTGRALVKDNGRGGEYFSCMSHRCKVFVVSSSTALEARANLGAAVTLKIQKPLPSWSQSRADIMQGADGATMLAGMQTRSLCYNRLPLLYSNSKRCIIGIFYFRQESEEDTAKIQHHSRGQPPCDCTKGPW